MGSCFCRRGERWGSLPNCICSSEQVGSIRSPNVTGLRPRLDQLSNGWQAPGCRYARHHGCTRHNKSRQLANSPPPDRFCVPGSRSIPWLPCCIGTRHGSDPRQPYKYYVNITYTNRPAPPTATDTAMLNSVTIMCTGIARGIAFD